MDVTSTPGIVKSITKTCDACPSQWDIELEDGTFVYVRFRYGSLFYGTSGRSARDAVGFQKHVQLPFKTGPLDGFLSTARMLRVLSEVMIDPNCIAVDEV